jgi:ABC-2 type transport system permease protein
MSVTTHRTPPRRLLEAELLKVRSTRVAWALLAGTLALALLSLVGVLAGEQRAPWNTAEGIRRIFVAAGAGGIFALALGILAAAGEERHGTLTQAFLAVPSRTPVLVAKIAAGALMGFVFGVVCCLFCVAVALPWAAADGQSIAFGSGTLWAVLGGVILSTTLYGALGAGLGELIGRQVPALLVSLGWFVVAESAIVAAFPEVGKWLPGGASSALTRSPDADDLLPVGWGALLLAAYVLAFAVAGIAAARRREVGA